MKQLLLPCYHRLDLVQNSPHQLAFGLYPPMAKLAYLDGASPSFVAIFTTFFRAFFLVIFCLLSAKKIIPAKGEWYPAISGGFFQALSIFGIIFSLIYLPGPVTIMILFTSTLMLLFFLAFKEEIKLTKYSILSTLAALFGISLVLNLWSQQGEKLPYQGILLALLAAVATMSRIYVFGMQVKKNLPAVVGARNFTAAFVFLLFLPISLPVHLPNSQAGLIASLFCSLSLVLGTFGMFYGIAALGPFKFSLFIKLEPVFTAMFSFFLLGELLSPNQYLGIFVVLGSLIFYEVFEGCKKIKD